MLHDSRTTIEAGFGGVEIGVIDPKPLRIPTVDELKRGMRAIGKTVIPIFCIWGDSSARLSSRLNRMVEESGDSALKGFMFEGVGCHHAMDDKVQGNKPSVNRFIAWMGTAKVAFVYGRHIKDKVSMLCGKYGIKDPPKLEIMAIKEDGRTADEEDIFRTVKRAYGLA